MISISPADKATKVVNLGEQGEYGKSVEFDLSAFVERYGEGQVKLFFRPPGGGSFTERQTEFNPPVLRWFINKEETRNNGTGHVEIHYKTDTVLDKSRSILTKVTKSSVNIDDGEDKPSEGVKVYVQDHKLIFENADVTAENNQLVIGGVNHG